MEFPTHKRPADAQPQATSPNRPQPRCLSCSRYVPTIWAEDPFEYLGSLEYLTNSLTLKMLKDLKKFRGISTVENVGYLNIMRLFIIIR